MLTSWWPWAYSSQVPWSLRIDNVNPCDTVLLPHHQPIKRIVHELITYPVTPLRYLAFKNTFLKSFGDFGVLEAWAIHFLAWPYNKPCSAPNSDISLLFGLTVHQAHELAFSYNLARQPRVWAHSRSTPATESPLSESPEAAGAHLLQGTGKHCPWEVPASSWHKTVWSKEMSRAAVHIQCCLEGKSFQPVQAGNSLYSIWAASLTGSKPFWACSL